MRSRPMDIDLDQALAIRPLSGPIYFVDRSANMARCFSGDAKRLLKDLARLCLKNDLLDRTT